MNKKTGISRFGEILRFYEHHRLLVWVGLLLLFNLTLNVLYFAFNKMNSDFVSFFFLFDELFQNKVCLPPDNFLFKFPLYSLFINWLGYTRQTVASLNLLNFGFMFTLVFALYASFVRKERKKGELFIFALIPCFVFINQSSFFFGFLAHPFLRNSEIGLMFLLLGFRYWDKLTKPLWAVLAVLIASLLFLSDPYFVYALAIPYVLTVLLIYAVRGKTSTQDRVFGLTLVLSAFISMLALALLETSKYFMMFRVRSAFVSWDKLGFNLGIVAQGFLKLFNADFLEEQLFSLQTVTHMLNLLVLGLGLWGLYLLAKKNIKSGSILAVFIPAAFIITLLAYALSDQVYDVDNTRYIILLPFFSMFGLYYAISRLLLVQKSRAIVFLALICLSVPLNIFSMGARLSAIPSVGDQYQENMAVLDAIREEGLVYGYGDYWDAALNTYLSGNEIKVRQIVYGFGKVWPYLWVASPVWYEPGYYEGSTFILLEEGELYRRTGGKDYLNQINDQFGEPAGSRVIETEDATYFLMIFNYNIASKF